MQKLGLYFLTVGYYLCLLDRHIKDHYQRGNNAAYLLVMRN
jgi:hypothetical protein